MVTAFEGTPQKVIRIALDNGAHPDCITAGKIDDACQDCGIAVEDAMSQVYGHIKNPSEALKAILRDLLEERLGT